MSPREHQPSSSTGRRGAAASVATASLCAFAIIATQVAGKATRDVLFLTNFKISALPLALMASAALSIGAVLLAARRIAARGPLRVIPPLFLASGVLMIGEWLLAMRSPRPASVIVYLHVAAIGSILISGFWSIVNEHFDPRTARRRIGRIVGSATIGGLFGGVLAARVGAYTSLLWVLPIIAVLHAGCGVLLLRLRPAGDVPVPPASPDPEIENARPRGEEAGFRLLARVGYLRNLALIVLLGNVAATFIDFLFKARAVESFSDSADMARFFAVFYTAVSVVTLAVQAGMTARILEGIGIANTMAIRPAVMIVGGLATLPVMNLAGMGVLRAVEGIIQSSLFRSGYELLFSPVVPGQKRRTKTIIDVGADRMGDVLGGAVIRAVILLPAAIAGQVLVALAILVSAIGFVVARALRRGYIRALEESLVDRANVLDIRPGGSAGMRTMMMETFTGLDLSMSSEIALDELRALTSSPPASAPAEESAAPIATETEPTRPLGASTDPEIESLLALRSGDVRRVHAELRRTRVLTPALTSQVVSLLAWDEVTGWASLALAKAAPLVTGQLIDRLLDPNEDFAIRRRIPRILSTCATPRAYDGLLASLADQRFEVRYQAARGLARIHEQLPSLLVDRDAVFAAVLRETQVGRPLWESQQLIDSPAAGDAPALVDESLVSRTNRGMEHVFTILSLVVPREPLQIAFKGLLTSDAVLRGTGLEYLESILPREIWNSLRPHLDATGAHVPSERPREEVLEDLLRSSPSIDSNLNEIKRRDAQE